MGTDRLDTPPFYPEGNYAEVRRWLAEATEQLHVARQRLDVWSWKSRLHYLKYHQRMRCRRVTAALEDAVERAEKNCHELMTRFAMDAALPENWLN